MTELSSISPLSSNNYLSNSYYWNKAINSCLIVFGIFGNVVTFLIFNKPSMKGTTISVYMRALLFCETLTLLSYCSYSILNDERIFGESKIAMFWIMCVVISITLAVCQQICSILICLIMIDKSFRIIYLRKDKIFLTKKKTQWLVLLTAFLTFAGYAFPIFCVNEAAYTKSKINYWPDQMFCYHTNYELSTLKGIASLIIEIACSYLLPVLILMIVNCIILKKLLYLSSKRNSMWSNEYRWKDNESKNMLIFLLILSTYYIITASIKLFFIFYSINLNLTSNKSVSLHKIYHIFQYFYISNYGSIFIFFCLSGKIFRQKFFELFRKRTETQSTVLFLSETSENNEEC